MTDGPSIQILCMRPCNPVTGPALIFSHDCAKLQVLEAAKKYNSPVMIQFSNGGSQFFAGKSLPNSKEGLEACVLGAVAVGFLLPLPLATTPYISAACHDVVMMRNILLLFPWRATNMEGRLLGGDHLE